MSFDYDLDNLFDDNNFKSFDSFEYSPIYDFQQNEFVDNSPIEIDWERERCWGHVMFGSEKQVLTKEQWMNCKQKEFKGKWTTYEQALLLHRHNTLREWMDEKPQDYMKVYVNDSQYIIMIGNPEIIERIKLHATFNRNLRLKKK